MYEGNLIELKSKSFAIRIIKLYKYLTEHYKEYVLSKQLLRSGTSIGANVREAEQAQSRKDFKAKMNIALKEASESGYWLELMYETGYISERQFNSIYNDCIDIIKILTAIVKNTETE